MSYNLTQGVNLRGRDNTPGSSAIYIAEHQNLTNVDISGDGIYVEDITMSGSTKFYEFLVPRNNLNFTNNTEISVENGTYVFMPMVNFNLPGLKSETLELFDVLVRKSVVVIVRSNENRYYLIGKDNGLDITSNSNFTQGLTSTDLTGSVIELEGLERTRIMEIDPTAVESLMNTISEPA